MPVFNGADFIRKSIDSLLAQTFSDFELIISDNCSSDATSDICEDYVKKDKRIRYVRQNQNIGTWPNYNYVLKEAQGTFFLWAAADDIWKPTFIEKNINVLLTNDDIVTSVSKIEFHNPSQKSLMQNMMGFLRSMKHVEFSSITGNYNTKVKLCLKSRMHLIYGLHRTAILRKSSPQTTFLGIDLATILNILKYGEINVLNESLFSIYLGGMSKKGYVSLTKQLNKSFLERVFPCLPLTKWCIHNLGTKLFLKNLGYFIQLNAWGQFSNFVDIIRIIFVKLSRR